MIVPQQSMASTKQVKEYLAYWFQLGKKVILGKSNQTLLPSRVFLGDRYSPEFEACWQQIITQKEDGAYLDGTNQTIAELLSQKWEITPCARCEMPVPMINLGVISPGCPCADLDNWPNLDLPFPRAPVDSRQHLSRLTQRLEEKESDS